MILKNQNEVKQNKYFLKYQINTPEIKTMSKQTKSIMKY